MVTDLVYFEAMKPRVIGDCLDVNTKAAILKVSPSVVGVMTFEVESSTNAVLRGSGLVIECEKSGSDTYSSIILTSCTLFTHTNGIPASEIRVRVFVASGDSHVAQVCSPDFHYNLAALRIETSTPLNPVSMETLDDVISLTPSQFSLRPHSSQPKIRPGDTLVALGRQALGSFFYTIGGFSTKYPELDCKELYSITTKHQDRGGPVINHHGQVIGIMMVEDYFLPSNVVSRWWSFFKLHKDLCRPWLGLMNVANLHAGRVCFLEQFLQKFPGVGAGVIVTQVSEKSAAYRSGLRAEDVIVQCDGGLVRSTMEFFERVWMKAGNCVELTALRLNSPTDMKITVKVGEAKENNFYGWPIPRWFHMPKTMPMPTTNAELESSESESDSESEESDSQMEAE